MTLVCANERKSATPWRAINELDREFGRLFGNARGTAFTDSEWLPAVDIREDAGGYALEADLPGMSKDDIDLTIENDVVTLKGERKKVTSEEQKGYHRTERHYGSFSRTFHVPGGVDSTKVKATFENGVLNVWIPKPVEAQPKRIEVKAK